MKASIDLSALLLIVLLIVSVSCNKDKTPEKDEHKDWNVLEWTVDGERYKAECEGDPLFGCDPVDCQYYHDVKGLSIHGTDLNNHGIQLSIYQNLSIGINDSIAMYDKIWFTNGNLNTNCARFYINEESEFHLKIIQLDTSNKLIEGKFDFFAANKCMDTSKISNGYFKLSYRP